jgi:hypothetical protein
VGATGRHGFALSTMSHSSAEAAEGAAMKNRPGRASSVKSFADRFGVGLFSALVIFSATRRPADLNRRSLPRSSLPGGRRSCHGEDRRRQTTSRLRHVLSCRKTQRLGFRSTSRRREPSCEVKRPRQTPGSRRSDAASDVPRRCIAAGSTNGHKASSAELPPLGRRHFGARTIGSAHNERMRRWRPISSPAPARDTSKRNARHG